MSCGRVFCRSWVLVIFLLLDYSFANHVYSGRSLDVSSCWRQIWTTQGPVLTAERRVFTNGLQVTSWFSVYGIVSTNNGADYAFLVGFVRPVRPRFLWLRIKAWFPYSCICRICRFCLIKKILTTDTTIWKPHTQPPNTTDTTDTTCSPR